MKVRATDVNPDDLIVLRTSVRTVKRVCSEDGGRTIAIWYDEKVIRFSSKDMVEIADIEKTETE